MVLVNVLIVVASVCVFIALLISSNDIAHHILYPRQPAVQKSLIRIIIMIPVFSIDSFIGMIWIEGAFFFTLLRDLYESYVIYIFFSLLVELMDGEEELAKNLANQENKVVSFPLPFCCIKAELGGIFLTNIKRSILQFVFINGFLAFVTFVLELVGQYGEGEWKNLNRGYIYITIIYNFTFSIALYGLVLFYDSTHHLMESYKPLAKFLCLKAAIFFAFWQGIAISLIFHLEIFPAEPFAPLSSEEAAVFLNNFLVIVEIMFCSVAFSYAFSVWSYDNPSAWRFSLILKSLNPFYFCKVTTQLPALTRGMKDVIDISDHISDSKKTFTQKARNFVFLDDFYDLPREEQRERVLLKSWAKKRSGHIKGLGKRRFFILLKKPAGIIYFEEDPSTFFYTENLDSSADLSEPRESHDLPVLGAPDDLYLKPSAQFSDTILQEKRPKEQETPNLTQQLKQQDEISDKGHKKSKEVEKLQQEESGESASNPERRKMSNPEKRERTSNPEQREAISNPEQRERISNPEQRERMSNPEQRETISNPEQRETISNPEQRETISNPEQRETISNPEQRETISNPEQRETISNPEQRETISNTEKRETPKQENEKLKQEMERNSQEQKNKRQENLKEQAKEQEESQQQGNSATPKGEMKEDKASQKQKQPSVFEEQVFGFDSSTKMEKDEAVKSELNEPGDMELAFGARRKLSLLSGTKEKRKRGLPPVLGFIDFQKIAGIQVASSRPYSLKIFEKKQEGKKGFLAVDEWIEIGFESAELFDDWYNQSLELFTTTQGTSLFDSTDTERETLSANILSHSIVDLED